MVGENTCEKLIFALCSTKKKKKINLLGFCWDFVEDLTGCGEK